MTENDFSQFNNFITRKFSIGLEPDYDSNKPRQENPVEFDWAGTDSSQAWNKNKAKIKQKQENASAGSYVIDPLAFYENNPIKYKLNNLWFRSEFDYIVEKRRKVDLYLGCSHTMGIGLHLEYLWPRIVSDHTGNDMINLGTGGHGIDVSYIVLKRFVDYYDVQNVFHFQPFYPRFNIINTDGEHSSICPAYNEDFNERFFTKEHLDNTLTDWGYVMFNYVRAIDAIKSVCKSRNIKYYFRHFTDRPSDNYSLKSYNKRPGAIRARDLRHFSDLAHKDIANSFIEVSDRYNYSCDMHLDFLGDGLA